MEAAHRGRCVFDDLHVALVELAFSLKNLRGTYDAKPFELLQEAFPVSHLWVDFSVHSFGTHECASHDVLCVIFRERFKFRHLDECVISDFRKSR